VTDDDELAEVVPLPSARAGVHDENRLDDELTVRQERTFSPCSHRRSSVDSNARIVRCRDCKAQLDPVDVLARLARDREAEVRAAQHTRRELEYLQREVSKLKREEANAKARIRRARSRRDDRAALEVAARAVPGGVGGHRPWESLSGPQREVVLERVRVCVEAYYGAVEEGAA